MRKPAEFALHPVSFTAAQNAGLVRGHCTHVTDGDTIDVFLDLGFHNYAYETLRISGIDAPEIYRPSNAAEREAGQRARLRVGALCLGRPVLIRSYRDHQTFGRFVADVYVHPTEASDSSLPGDWRDLASILVEEQLVTPG